MRKSLTIDKSCQKIYNNTNSISVTITMFRDGVAVPGATATATAAAAGTVNLSFPAIVRQQCYNSSSMLTFVLTGTAATLNNDAGVSLYFYIIKSNYESGLYTKQTRNFIFQEDLFHLCLANFKKIYKIDI